MTPANPRMVVQMVRAFLSYTVVLQSLTSVPVGGREQGPSGSLNVKDILAESQIQWIEAPLNV